MQLKNQLRDVAGRFLELASWHAAFLSACIVPYVFPVSGAVEADGRLERLQRLERGLGDIGCAMALPERMAWTPRKGHMKNLNTSEYTPIPSGYPTGAVLHENHAAFREGTRRETSQATG